MATATQNQLRLPVELKAESVVAICDSREQLPLNLSPLQTEVGTLSTGDYSIKGLEHVVAIERKSLPDLLGCVGRDRERFDREVQRLLAYPVRCLVVESTWAAIEIGDWTRSRVTPRAATGSLLGWIAAGLPIIMAGDHERAGRYVSRLLFIAARRRWREMRQFMFETSQRPGSGGGRTHDQAGHTRGGGGKSLERRPPPNRIPSASFFA
jgi:DNA excision repair protein ERCC-4